MKKFITVYALFWGFTTNAATPFEIIDFYKTKNPRLSIESICNAINNDIENRKGNLFVISKNGWTVSESEAALKECHNQRITAIPPSQLKKVIDRESKRCDDLQKKANSNFNALALTLGRKADAEAAYAKCEVELLAHLEEMKKTLADYEAEKAQKAADSKAHIDAKNESTELPNLPLAYYKKDQAQAYMAAMNKVVVAEVLSRSSFRPFLSAGKGGLINSWTLNLNVPRNIYAHALRIQCFQTIAGNEKRVEVRVGEKGSDIYKGQLNTGINQITVDVWFVDDETFPVSNLIENVRCVASNRVHSSQFSSEK